MADQITPPVVYSPSSDVNVLVARLGEQLIGMKESLARIERQLEGANNDKAAIIATISAHKQEVEKQHLEHKAEVDKRLSAVEKTLEGYRSTIKWLVGGLGTVLAALALDIVRGIFRW